MGNPATFPRPRTAAKRRNDPWVFGKCTLVRLQHD